MKQHQCLNETTLMKQHQILACAPLSQGFVGMGTFSGRLEPVRTPPPYDEFRILEEAWSSMRTVVEVRVCVCAACVLHACMHLYPQRGVELHVHGCGCVCVMHACVD